MTDLYIKYLLQIFSRREVSRESFATDIAYEEYKQKLIDATSYTDATIGLNKQIAASAKKHF